MRQRKFPKKFWINLKIIFNIKNKARGDCLGLSFGSPCWVSAAKMCRWHFFANGVRQSASFEVRLCLAHKTTHDADWRGAEPATTHQASLGVSTCINLPASGREICFRSKRPNFASKSSKLNQRQQFARATLGQMPRLSCSLDASILQAKPTSSRIMTSFQCKLSRGSQRQPVLTCPQAGGIFACSQGASILQAKPQSMPVSSSFVGANCCR